MKRYAKAWRVASLFLPSLLAGGYVVARGRSPHLVTAAAQALVPLALILCGALVVRLVEGAIGRRALPLAAHLDLLTATGRSVMWTGAGAIVASVATGWASLAVLGILGLGAVYVTATWTLLVAGGLEPWRAARITRAILPALSVEGDELREEVTLRGVRIPAGFRLFAASASRPRGRGATTRYVIGSDNSGAEIRLESPLGPAPRGEHQAPPLQLRLSDVLGLCRTPIIEREAASYTALPRPVPVDGAQELLGRGGDDQRTMHTHRLPTEGTFRLRAYAPGDDTRRIHWVRSLQANQLVVRLPDEIPPAEPSVRLVLDSQLVGAGSLTCRAPDELLDALVRVWLSVGKAIAERGTRVTIVAAAKRGERLTVVERPMVPRSPREALRLGARVSWQGEVGLDQLVGHGAGRRVVVSSRPRPLVTDGDVRWIVVPEAAWTAPEPPPPPASWVLLPFAIGSADNRLSHRLEARRTAEEARRDGAIFDDLLAWTDHGAHPGALLARPNGARLALEVLS